MSSLAMYSHFHKDFPFNWNSKWIFPTYADKQSPNPSLPYLNVNDSVDSINKFQHYYSHVSEEQFLIAMGAQATEYWMLNNAMMCDYIGCTTYRRYLMLHRNGPKDVPKISVPATQENANAFGTDEQFEVALEYLQTAEVLTNQFITMGHSIEAQYLMYEPEEYWNFFKSAIRHLFPQYRSHMNWFTHNNTINFETTYIMRRDLFQRYAQELFSILEFIWKNCSEVYPTKQTTSEPLPWRYPGFLGERFFPFFVYANSLKQMQVPLVILE